jgi:PPM family protein phosphatase
MELLMPELGVRVGAVSNQGLRSNNEDRLLVDLQKGLFVVADGMGGQEAGELASGLAVEVIPRVLEKCLSANEAADRALLDAMAEANQAIIDAGIHQPIGRRMGTTAVCALKSNGQLFVTNMGDSRAYLIREGKSEQLTVDHTVAAALVACGALTAEEALTSPFNNRLYKFLGCTETNESADVKPLTPRAGDWLLLATDGLTNFVAADDLQSGPGKFGNPQTWAEHLVKIALERGSRDNVTCIVVAFEETKSS